MKQTNHHTYLLRHNSIQMFIGEMGCWLVVLMTNLYKRYFAPRLFQNQSPLLAGGYRPVNDVDGEDYEEDQTIDGPNDDDDPSKPFRLSDGRIKLQGLRTFLLAAPACCDIAGTTLMNVGLLFVAASIYQMTRGALVLFVGLFSVLFLHRKLYLYQWLALFIVVLGVALVGLAGALFGDKQGHDITQEGVVAAAHSATLEIRAVAQTPEAVRAVIGVLLIAAAQIFTASQFVLEEWILENYAMEPLQVVGWEGVFGFTVTVIGSIILYLGVGRTEAGRYGYFDAKEGWHQVLTHRAVAVSSFMIMLSIGYACFFSPFNFFLSPTLS
jgi:drug/metabolite transporter (DMT)-like permease